MMSDLAAGASLTSSVKAMSRQDHMGGHMSPPVSSHTMNGYDGSHHAYQDMQQNFPSQQNAYIPFVFAQHAQQLHTGGFDITAMARMGGGGEEENLKFQFPVAVLSLHVLSTGMCRNCEQNFVRVDRNRSFVQTQVRQSSQALFSHKCRCAQTQS